MLVSTVKTVTRHAPQTVKTTRATYRVDLVSHVSLDGLEYIVKQNVKKDGTVSTVNSSVKDIVEMELPVTK